MQDLDALLDKKVKDHSSALRLKDQEIDELKDKLHLQEAKVKQQEFKAKNYDTDLKQLQQLCEGMKAEVEDTQIDTFKREDSFRDHIR